MCVILLDNKMKILTCLIIFHYFLYMCVFVYGNVQLGIIAGN